MLFTKEEEQQLKDMYAREAEAECNAPELYTIQEVLDLLKKGHFVFDFLGHFNSNFNSKASEIAENTIIHILERMITHYTEIAKSKADPGNYFARKLGGKIKQGTPIIDTVAYAGEYCFTCGKILPYILKDANTISLGFDFNMRLNNIQDNTCKFAGGVKPKECEITIDSGTIVIANYFDDRKSEKWKTDTCYYSDTQYENERVEVFEPKDKWDASLNSHAGRINRMKWYSEQHNIAYGQMGNMSMGVFVNPEGTKIIIGDSDYDDYARDREKNDVESFIRDTRYQEAMDSGFKWIGSISLNMWRWMATDKAVLDKYEIPVKGNINSSHCDFVVQDVQKGKWKVTHYYDTPHESHDFVYATLELIEPSN